jgi:hypothetical protein
MIQNQTSIDSTSDDSKREVEMALEDSSLSTQQIRCITHFNSSSKERQPQENTDSGTPLPREPSNTAIKKRRHLKKRKHF